MLVTMRMRKPARHEEALALYRKAGQEQHEALCLDRLKSLR